MNSPAMPKMNPKRIDDLRKKKAQIEAELLRLEARSRVESRKADTRRKILIGAITLQEMEARADINTWVRKLLNERLTKDRDRALFGLKSLPPALEERHKSEKP